MPSNISKSWTPEQKSDFARMISRVCALQRTYGKTQNDIPTLVEGFAWALAPYPFEKVIWAFGEFIRSNPDLPTPSDIRLLIDPPKPEWKPDWAVYNRLLELKRNGGTYAIGEDEHKYIHACEAWSLGQLEKSK